MKRKVATGILVLSILISSLAGCGAAHTDTAAVAGREAATDTEVSAAAQNSEAASEEAQVMDETAEEGNHANGTPWLNSDWKCNQRYSNRPEAGFSFVCQ